MKPQIEDRPDLGPAVLPSSPLGAKRIIRDNGAWVKALKRDNVRLSATPIDCINERGVVFEDQTHCEFDVLIYGTGFQAADLVPDGDNEEKGLAYVRSGMTTMPARI